MREISICCPVLPSMPEEASEMITLVATESQLKNKAMLGYSQHVFMKSCLSTLIMFYAKVCLGDERKVVDISLDFNKAFDTIPHRTLLEILFKMDIKNKFTTVRVFKHQNRDGGGPVPVSVQEAFGPCSHFFNPSVSPEVVR